MGGVWIRFDRIAARLEVPAMARLFIPGPTDVAPQILQAQAQPMIGHRSEDCDRLFARAHPRLRQILQTRHRVFITASSGSGLQEAALRNLVSNRVLCCVCGSFGERWFDIARGNGLAADRLDAEWGEPNRPEAVAAALRSQRYDAVAVVHNETSTGVENPVPEIAAAARAVQPDVLILVDAVSSAGGVDIRTDEWGLDVLLTSSQKCLALPPGLAFAAVSDRAMQAARRIPHRGWYFDFVLLEEYLAHNTTPATPAISLLFALDAQLDRILAEGLPARFQRHTSMAARVQHWGEARLGLFAAAGFRSRTVTTLRTPPGLSFPHLRAYLAEADMSIADGYGRLKGSTLRIAHMGEIQPADLDALLSRIDAFLDGSSGSRR
jgi:aspartate aminotransferase-like enzyme